jgi:hypothetical protein
LVVRCRAGRTRGWDPVLPSAPSGDVALPGLPQQADRQVAQGRYHLEPVPGADLAGVLAEGHIPHPVRPVLDLPLAADQHRQAGRVGPGSVQAGDAVGDLGARVAAGEIGGMRVNVNTCAT